MRIIDRFDEYMTFKHLNDNRATKDLGFSIGMIGKSRSEGRDLSKRPSKEFLLSTMTSMKHGLRREKAK